LIPTVHKLEPAYSLIEKLGGKSAVAEAIGLDKSALSRWCMPRPGGTGGVVPQRHWPALMRMARAQNVSLAVRELADLDV
jgi:hypothetical protein